MDTIIVVCVVVAIGNYLFFNHIIKKLEKDKNNLIEALIDEVKHCYYDTGSYSEKSMELLEKEGIHLEDIL